MGNKHIIHPKIKIERDFEEDIIYAITLQHKHKWGFINLSLFA